MDKNNDIVIGLLLGDETKGATVSFLASENQPKANLRFSGGCQAAHNVYHPKTGAHHTFAQFGAATFYNVPTILSKYMMVEPYSLAKEGMALIPKAGFDVFSKLIISKNSLITTPIHKFINRIKEMVESLGYKVDTKQQMCQLIKMHYDF